MSLSSSLYQLLSWLTALLPSLSHKGVGGKLEYYSRTQLMCGYYWIVLKRMGFFPSFFCSSPTCLFNVRVTLKNSLVAVSALNSLLPALNSDDNNPHSSQKVTEGFPLLPLHTWALWEHRDHRMRLLLCIRIYPILSRGSCAQLLIYFSTLDKEPRRWGRGQDGQTYRWQICRQCC